MVAAYGIMPVEAVGLVQVRQQVFGVHNTFYLVQRFVVHQAERDDVALVRSLKAMV